MAKKDEGMDLKKIIADAERYTEAVSESNRLGSYESPTPRELYDIAKELYALALCTLKDKIRSFERLGSDLGFIREDDDEDEDEDERESA